MSTANFLPNPSVTGNPIGHENSPPLMKLTLPKRWSLRTRKVQPPFHPTVTMDPPLSPRSTRKRVNQYIHDIDVAEQLEHLRTLQVQGKWPQWSERMHQDLSWQQLIHNWSDAELRFALQATTDTAPSATNLRRWGVANTDPACCLCGKPATSHHVLNACAVALKAGTPGDTTPCFLSSVTICTSAGSFQPLNVPLK